MILNSVALISSATSMEQPHVLVIDLGHTLLSINKSKNGELPEYFARRRWKAFYSCPHLTAFASYFRQCLELLWA